MHPNVEKIIDYPHEELMDFGRIYDLIHPEDRDFIFEFSIRTITLAKSYKEELLKDPFQPFFSIDFRIQHKNGHYIRVNRQTTCLKTDREGNMVYALVR